MQMPSFPTFQT